MSPSSIPPFRGSRIAMPEKPRSSRCTLGRWALWVCLCALTLPLMPSPMTQLKAQEASTSTAASSTNSQPSVPVLPRGKKLMLKDGSFQLVREYQVQGDRVRDYDMDSSTWQVMPA